MADLISIRSDVLSASINPLGAELWQLADDAGRHLMTDADPLFWTGRAPLLFPVVGALAGDEYRLGDQRFTMPKHGFARRSAFAVVDAQEDRALFRLEADAATRAAYPFAFRLDMGFEITGPTLAMTATVCNRGDTPMPFSFGFHPAFAWPLPFGGAAQDHRVTFAQDEPASIRRIDRASGLIAPHICPSPVAGRVYAPTPADFEADALIWDQLASRALHWGVPGQTGLDIAFPDTPMLGIWQKPGAPWLCIEPWAGMADPLGYAGSFTDKPGVMVLAPGEQRSFRMDVTLAEAAAAR